MIQTRYSPDAVVINAEMEILQFRGHTAPYIDPSPGEATLNLLRMAKESLMLPLRRAVQKALESATPVHQQAGSIEINGRPEDVSIEVTPNLGRNAGGALPASGVYPESKRSRCAAF